MAEKGNDIQKAAALLAEGKLVAIPTETVYGLSANALNENAVAQIFEVKKRPATNPLIIHIPGKELLGKYVSEIPPLAEKLIDAFWPGPLTLLLPKKSIVPDAVTANLPHVAVRVPNHPLALALLNSIDFPLAAPSANPFGYISPTTPDHVEKQIGDKIPYILDGGACMQGVESTIVGFIENEPMVYRLGAITLEELEEVAGKMELHINATNKPLSPGMLPYHYSPKTPFILTEDIIEEIKLHDTAKTGVITFQKTLENIPLQNALVLSPSGNIREAARNLYSALHHMDAMNLKAIIAEKFPDEGLGKTLNDRLKKASSKEKPL